MIQALIFDLDGVLIDTPDMHYATFSTAYYRWTNKTISKKEHDLDFNGKSTKTKLQTLKERDNLSDDICEKIWKTKQTLTSEYIHDYIKRDEQKIELFKKLEAEGFLIACASNAITKTVFDILENMGILRFFNIVISNEQVLHPKPSAEIYIQAMIRLNCNPNNTLIIEDSQIGYEAAISTKAEVLRVVNSKDVTYENIKERLQLCENKTMKHKYKNDKLTVVIPASGYGSRFAEKGYVFPKPLITVNDKSMIETVVDCLNIDANYIFIVLKEHNEKFNIGKHLEAIVPNCKIIFVEEVTSGAAATVLLAEDYINNEDPILIVNSDQFVSFDVFDFIKDISNRNLDGSILTFTSNHVKWSFVQIDNDCLVKLVKEKCPLPGNHATVGIYYWSKGSDYVKYAKQMIFEKDARTNGEHYVAPVWNEAIEDGKKVGIFNVDIMESLGCPEDLEAFLKKYHY